MAYIRYKQGTRKLIPDEIGTPIWLVLHGYRDTEDPKQRAFIQSVDEVTLNWKTAPDEYIKHNFNDIAERMISSWRVDMFGRPSRPEYGTDLQMAQKWGLWAGGKPTALAKEIVSHMKSNKRRVVQTSLVV